MRVGVSFGLQQGMDGVNRIVYSDLTSNAFFICHVKWIIWDAFLSFWHLNRTQTPNSLKTYSEHLFV